MERVPHILMIGGSDAILSKVPGQPVRVTYAQRTAAITPFSRACAGRTIAVEYTSSSAMLAIASRLHAEDPLDAVISLDEYALNVAAEISEELGIVGCKREAVLMGRDKRKMRERLRSCGIDKTRFQVCRDVEDAKRFAGEVGGRVIVKPADGAGGLGVRAAESVTEVAAAWEFAINASRESAILVEERIYGQEYSVETVTVHGRHTALAVTKKSTTGYPYFVEIGHAASGDLTSHSAAPLVQSVLAALDAIGVEVGPCHTEAIVHADGVSLVEINTRPGGGFIWELIELATGVDVIRSSIASLVGAEVEPGNGGRGAAVAFMSSAEPGLVRSVHGVDIATSMPGVVRIGRIPESGTMVYPLSDRSHRLGYAIAVGSSADEAAVRARQAADSVRLDLAALPKAGVPRGERG